MSFSLDLNMVYNQVMQLLNNLFHIAGTLLWPFIAIFYRFFRVILSLIILALRLVLWLIIHALRVSFVFPLKLINFSIKGFFHMLYSFIASPFTYWLVILSICSLEYYVLPRLEDEFRWIRRESRFLRAFQDDYLDLKSKTDTQTESRSSSQLSNSRRNAESKTLSRDTETPGAEVTEIDHRAKILVATFDKYRRKSFERYVLVFQIWGTNKIKKMITDRLDKLKPKLDEFRSLYRSWSKLNENSSTPVQSDCLADMNASSVLRQLPSLLVKVNALITMKKHLIRDVEHQIQFIDLQLFVLDAFRKDLKNVKLETATERAWVMEVKDFIADADNDIETFMERTAKKNSLPSVFNFWIPRMILKRQIDRIDDGFRGLYEAKEKYGFKFVRRQQQSLPHQSNPLTSPVADSLLHYLEQNRDKSIEVSSEVSSLLRQLRSLRKKLDEVAKETQGRSNTINACLEKERSIRQSAVDCIKKYSAKYHPDDTKAEPDLSMEISRIECLIQLIHRSVDVYRIEEIRQKPSSLIGLEEDAHALVSRLINEPYPVVSIVGMPEIGKTTLAKIVSEHSAIREHFAYRAWVSIPEQCSDNALHDDVANQVPRTNWLEEVKVSLKEKKCLLVLDNISTKEAWNSVQAEFSKKEDGSKILLTTRDRKVASHASQNPTPHHLRLRTKEESWQLFIHKVQFPPDLPSEEQALPTAKKLVEICGGLPRAIEILVDKISGKDVTNWEVPRVIELINQCLTRLSEDLVMDDPPHGLNNLISYLRLFPRDFEIPARRLIALWAAELVPADGNETVEDVAEKKLLELIDLNIIRVVQKKINGKIKTCQLPGFLRERCLSKFGSSDLLLADHFHSDDANFANIHGTSKITDLKRYNNLLSFLSFDFREGNKPGEDIGNFLRRTIASFQLLRVLDLELVFRPQLPNSIGNLIELRYLGLRWTYLETIPSSIGKLLKLQTLDVKHTCLRTISSSIWKLKKLRHLYLNESYRSKFMHQPSASSLKNLQTLWGAFVDEDSPLHDGLRKLTNLRKLGLALELTPSQQERLARDVAKLKNLKALRLRSIDKTGKPQDLCLGSLKDLENLSSLYLFGWLTNPYIISEFPQGLSDLTLSGSGLKDDPMTNLCKLPNLKSLCFYSDSYEGQRMVCTAGGFPQLLVLKFWKLEKLERWNVMEGGMQNLRELEIRSCKRLEVPTGLNHLKTLRELTLTDMPEKLAETIKEKRNDIFRSDVASFPVITIKKLASS